MTAALIAIDGLSVAYRGNEGWQRVLHDVSLTIDRGEVLGLVGESGCGKSTVAYHLLGYRRPNSRVDGGRILFDGRDLLALDRPALDDLRGNRISFVPQNPTTALSPGMPVGRQIAEVLEHHRRASTAIARRERTLDLLRLVGLPDPERIAGRYPHQLSGGQQQRVIIAMALSCEPALIVLDEPTTGLDVTTQAQIIALLADLRRRLGMSMLYVTHDLGVLAQIADRVAVMYAGHVVETATTEALFGQPRHPYTQGLIASVPDIEPGSQPGGNPLRGLLRREELPAGCPFQPRCDFAEASCATVPQRLVAIAAGRAVACQRWQVIQPPPSATADRVSPKGILNGREPLLKLENVTLAYGRRRTPWARLFETAPAPVVHNLSFGIGRGEVFALVGESGSGKSTAARAISGLIEPSEGRILFDGALLPPNVRRRDNTLRRRIQYIFQNPDASLNPRIRVAGIVGRPLQMFAAGDGADRRQRIAEALLDVRLDRDYAGRFPDQLSGGERQRVAIARALIAKPTLLLCDEVLSALDVSVQANVLELLRRLRREHDLAMLFISHDLAVVRNLADRVGVLFGGHLMEIGGVADVFAPPFHPYTHSLLMAAPSIKARRHGAPPRASAERRLGAGCAYAGRCPWQLGRQCDDSPPPWRETPSGLGIRCHIPLDELAGRATWRPAALADT